VSPEVHLLIPLEKSKLADTILPADYKQQKTAIVSQLGWEDKGMLLMEQLDMEQWVSDNNPANAKLTEVGIHSVIGAKYSRLLVLSNAVTAMKPKINEMPKGVRLV
jgi:hypothetical protein